MEIKIDPITAGDFPGFLIDSDIKYLREAVSVTEEDAASAERMAKLSGLRFKQTEGPFLSAGQYSHLNIPSLSELVRAYRTSEEFRSKALARRGYGEWTSTLLRDGKELIESPVLRQEESGLWVVEDCCPVPVEIPEDGWVEEYDLRTGLPSKTVPRKTFASDEAHDRGMSYFFARRQGLVVVSVEHNELENGRFYVRASDSLHNRIAYLGARSIRQLAA